MTGRKPSCTVSLLPPGLPPVWALATDVKKQSSTRYLWYNDPFQDKPQGEILRYAKLSATEELRTASNYRFVFGDPGAHAHNNGCAAQRLRDSLDELDDGALNGFVPPERPPSENNHNRKGGVRDRSGHANGNAEEKSGF